MSTDSEGPRSDGDPREAIQVLLQDLQRRRQYFADELAVVDREIDRYETALAVLDGDLTVGNQRRGSRTAGIAIVAALNSFSGPVHTSTLLDHDDLVNYSRTSLRSALSELKRTGQLIPVERTPHGYIWQGGR